MSNINDFSHRTLVGLKTPGDYRDAWSDVKGLILRVKPLQGGGVTKQWLWRYTLPGTNGKRETISPGLFPAIGAAKARELVREYAKSLKQGINPKDRREREKKEAAQSVQRHTFKEVATEYWEDHHKSWKNLKHRAQWKDSWMGTYTYPLIGSISVADIRLADIEKVLRPIWQDKQETAKKVTSAIGSVLEYAVAKGWRDEDLVNPCKQRERLVHLLSKVKREKLHQASLHYEDVPRFYAELIAALDGSDNPSSLLGLEFAMLTGIRTANVLTLEWDEVDLKKKLVNVPASKMKGGKKDFSYPLIDRAIKILETRKAFTSGKGFVFRGRNSDKPMSQGAMLEAIKALCGVKGIKTSDKKLYKPKYFDRQSGRRITVHGFRSTLVSWAEDYGHAIEDCEAIIAHTKGDQNLAAYARGNKIEIRRKICEEYYEYLTAGTASTTLAK